MEFSKEQYKNLLSLSHDDFIKKILNKKFKDQYRKCVVARTDDETAEIVLEIIDEISELLQKKNREEEILNFFDLFDGRLIGDYPIDLKKEKLKRLKQ